MEWIGLSIQLFVVLFCYWVGRVWSPLVGFITLDSALIRTAPIRTAVPVSIKLKQSSVLLSVLNVRWGGGGGVGFPPIEGPRRTVKVSRGLRRSPKVSEGSRRTMKDDEGLRRTMEILIDCYLIVWRASGDSIDYWRLSVVLRALALWFTRADGWDLFLPSAGISRDWIHILAAVRVTYRFALVDLIYSRQTFMLISRLFVHAVIDCCAVNWKVIWHL